MVFRWSRLAHFYFMGRNFQPVFGIVCLFAWAVPIESLAQSPLLGDDISNPSKAAGVNDLFSVASKMALEITKRSAASALGEIDQRIIADCIVTVAKSLPPEVAKQMTLNPRGVIGWAARITDKELAKDISKVDPLGFALGVGAEAMEEYVRSVWPHNTVPENVQLELIALGIRETTVAYSFARGGLHGAIAAQSVVTVKRMLEASQATWEISDAWLKQPQREAKDAITAEFLLLRKTFKAETDPTRKKLKLARLDAFLAGRGTQIFEGFPDPNLQRRNYICAFARAASLQWDCPASYLGNNQNTTLSEADAVHAADKESSGLSGIAVAQALGPTREHDRAAAIADLVKQGAIRSQLTADELALILKGTTGGNRSYAIAKLSSLIKSYLTAPEAATVLGTVNELREHDRAVAIQSIAKANAYAELSGDAALILEGTTGGNRSFSIAELANFFKKRLGASAISEILGSVQQLREHDRAEAIKTLVHASIPGSWGGETSEPLNGCTGGNRSFAIAQLASGLRSNLTGAEVSSILGRPEELREHDRATAIQSLVNAKRLRKPFSGEELGLVLTGTTGGNRSFAIRALTQHL
jgi:hypothetical protein